MIRKVAFSLVLFLLSLRFAFAQQDICPNIVREALAAADRQCNATGRNQACYGNVVLQAEAQADVSDFNFDQPGDVEEIAGMKILRLSPLDRTSNVWGVALMRIQAGLPDTVPGQNVTFLLFGDVEIVNRVVSNTDPLLLPITTTTGANIRSRPSTSGALIGSLVSGARVIADGRVADGSWLRIRLPEQDTQGWVFADLVTVEGDIALLDVMEDSEPTYGPMQAFYFKTGVNDAPCSEAPDSGILIQTPEGAGKINLSVNDVKIQFGSTLYLQAQAGADMVLNVLEGGARIESNQVAQFAPAGTRVRIPLDANLNASGSPTPPEPYDSARLAVLPIANLERQIIIARPLTPAQIQAALATPTPPSLPITAGAWTIVETLLEKSNSTCDMSTSWTWAVTMVMSEDGASFSFVYPEGGSVGFSRVGDSGNTYIGSGYNRTYVLTFTSPTTFNGDVNHISANWICVDNQAHWRWDGHLN